MIAAEDLLESAAGFVAEYGQPRSRRAVRRVDGTAHEDVGIPSQLDAALSFAQSPAPVWKVERRACRSGYPVDQQIRESCQPHSAIKPGRCPDRSTSHAPHGVQELLG